MIFRLLGIRTFRLDYDTDYGIDRRTGWSCHLNGRCYTQFRRFALVAVLAALGQYVGNRSWRYS